MCLFEAISVNDVVWGDVVLCGVSIKCMCTCSCEVITLLCYSVVLIDVLQLHAVLQSECGCLCVLLSLSLSFFHGHLWLLVCCRFQQFLSLEVDTPLSLSFAFLLLAWLLCCSPSLPFTLCCSSFSFDVLLCFAQIPSVFSYSVSLCPCLSRSLYLSCEVVLLCVFSTHKHF